MTYTTPYDLVKGKTIAERFKIAGTHRQSGFAAAYSAVDMDGTPCEVSLFPSGMFDEPEQAGEFLTRLAPWTEISSEHVLGVREVLQLEGGMLLVTDVPRGETLRERLDRDGHTSPQDVATLGTRLLEGLDAIHAVGLTHGDIKPRTIHLAGKGAGLEAMLVDGGVTPGIWNAKGLGEKTALIGTPYYAPMEQFGGDAPDVRSDIYNLATVLYECATGVLPWTGASFLEVFQSKLNDPPPMRQRASEVEVPPALEAAILHGCLADRRKRYGSAREFKEALTGAV
jgi:serine/threonine protein kinase